jgi:hypothetical protein
MESKSGFKTEERNCRIEEQVTSRRKEIQSAGVGATNRREDNRMLRKKPFDEEGFLILEEPAQFLACGAIFDYFLIQPQFLSYYNQRLRGL